MPERLARLALRHRAATLVLLATLTSLLGFGLPQLKTDVGYRAFLGADHPAVRRLDALLERFGGGLPLAAVWSCDESPCRSALDASSLAMAHAITEQMKGAPGVRRVDSPATSPLPTQPLIGLPETRQLAPNGEPAADLEELRRAALEDPMWVGQLISPDGVTGAVLIHLTDSKGSTGATVYAALRDAVAPYEAEGYRFSFAGGPVEFVVAGGELDRNTAKILPLMIGIIAIILLWVFRSWAATAAALVTVGIAVLWTFGLMGWLGWQRNSFTQALAPLVLVIGVCDAVHLLSRYLAQAAAVPRGDALLAACGEVGNPCLMTSLTTAAGFASLAISPLESLVRFGLLAVFGVLAALFLTFTLLPVVLSYVPRRFLGTTLVHARWDAGLERLAAGAQRRRGAVLATTLLLAMIAAVALRSLQLEASFEDLYGEGSQVVRWAQTVANRLRLPDTLEIAVEPPPDLKETPEAFAVTERLEDRLQGISGLGRARSIVDPMRRLDAMLHRDDLALNDGDLAAERTASLLRLMRSQDSDLTALFLHRPSGAMRISVEAHKLPQADLRRMLAKAHAAAEAEVPHGWSTSVTGPVSVVHEMIDEIRTTQLNSFVLAAVIVFFMVAGFFRTFSDTVLSAVPTFLPVLLTLGAMGAAGIALDVGSAMVATVVVGIAVDDAIHVLTAYRRERRRGLGAAEACGAAIRHAGRALTATSVALTLGFFTLILSPWKSIASFGLIAGIAIASAWAATLVVLPALLASRPPRS